MEMNLDNNNMCNEIMTTSMHSKSRRSSSCVIIRSVLLLCNVAIWGTNAEWIDIDTPLDKRTTTSLIDKTVYHLVMSDEFNVDNRSFTDGDDPMWTALDKSDDDASSAGGGSMHFYNSTNVYTEGGFLKISTLLEKTEWNRYDHVDKQWKRQVTNFTSGMVQSWEKFCFTGGIVEIDVIFPGDPYVGGLWPALWMLGNLGRATYEASTNNIWPWSYNECNRSLQQAQTISACNKENHFGMKPNQGRGATEIDIVEVMTGPATGGLPGTHPLIDYPYCDFTLQVAPGVVANRPQSGHAPLRKNVMSSNGHTQFIKDTWYDGLEMMGNTSVNPFFYGTYLAETKPNEPVTRSKDEAFQADAVGAAHQLTPSHFQTPHTFRLEWQPGPGGRLDWFVKNHKLNETTYIEGNGKGQEWLHAYSLKDESIRNLMGSQIPVEPTYLIFNVAVSSTWGFPYDTPEWCTKCFDCDDPKCACNFYPGFCQMIRSGKTAMYVDNVRIYQSRDPDAHVGAHHTLGCDPPDYPTHEWVVGHEYRYMRNPPFSYLDKHPLRKIQNGGGSCITDEDCGGSIESVNLTDIYEESHDDNETTIELGQSAGRLLESIEDDKSSIIITGRGKCVLLIKHGLFGKQPTGTVCSCAEGFTGPHCLTLDHIDESPKASILSKNRSPFARIYHIKVPGFMMGTLLSCCVVLFYILLQSVRQNKKSRLVTPKPVTPINGNSNSNSNSRINNRHHPWGPEAVPAMNQNKSGTSENAALITGRGIY